MQQILESVPNFSEGRDLAVVERLADAFRGRENVRLLDYSADHDHNRCVISVAGAPDALRDAMVDAVGRAVQLIDMTRHTGQHPCMGCVDVIPFIPLKNCTLADADRVARETAALAAEKFGQPFFLYEHSATAPHRRNLADVRRGQFAGMAEKMRDPLWRPDFGPPAIHPTGGVTAIGARAPLVAFNVNLNTPDVEIAREIARQVRFSNHGLPGVKAIGVRLAARDQAQVSMNLTDLAQTSVYQAFSAVREAAAQRGVDVAGSELIGLLPLQALAESAAQALQLENFSLSQVLENRLYEE